MRRLVPLLVVLVVLVVIASAGYLALESVYFVGTNTRGLVTLYRGVPYQLPGGIDLYSPEYVTGVSVSTLSPARRRTLLEPLVALGRRRGRPAAHHWNWGSSVNRPIVRLYGLVVVLFALLIAFTSRWTVFEAASLRQNPLNRRALLEQETHRTRADPRRRRDGARPQRPWPRRHVSTDLPDRLAVRPGDRLLLHRSRSGGPGALPQPRPGRRNDRYEPAGDSRPAAGQAPAGRRSPHHARPGAPSARRSRPWANTRGRRGARPAHRRGQGDGFDAEL